MRTLEAAPVQESALVSSDCWRIRSKIQATSAKPVAREPDPAAADQARLPSPWRARVSLHGSSATGIHSGHSKPSATFSSAARLRATNAANLLMSFPDDSSPSGLPERPAHPKFPFATVTDVGATDRRFVHVSASRARHFRRRNRVRWSLSWTERYGGFQYRTGVTELARKRRRSTAEFKGRMAMEALQKCDSVQRMACYSPLRCSSIADTPPLRLRKHNSVVEIRRMAAA